MGEAKRRGTYGQRKSVAEAKLAVEKKRRQELLAAMTPEERQRKQSREHMRALLLTSIGGKAAEIRQRQAKE